ncbi:ISLre2 family transposase [Orenia marismortui]|uniref:ISLre2 family transposase n=1 Tax=Orenia marismortui TaxID=46469 RepID=UPI00036ACDC7|nr:ISLre2 family transposase [Orenia marismortui]
MDTIIQQFGEKIKDNSEEFLKNILLSDKEDISDFINTLRKDFDELGKELCKYIIEVIDEVIKESPERKKNWKIVRKKKRKLITEFGEVEFERRYYKSKFNKEYEHLADKKLGIDKYQRIDTGLEAKIVDLSIDKSYAKVGEEVVNNLTITGQTVMNKIRKLGKIENDKLSNPKAKRKIDYLYIEADEDHVSLQNGKNAVPRLVYVHEGIIKENGRNKLKNSYSFSGMYNKSEDLWLEIMDYIEDNYDFDSIKQIYIAGDGALWIKEGLKWLPKSKQILDRYHLNKYVLKATGHAQKLRFDLWQGINNLDKVQIKEIFSELISQAEKESKKKAIRQSRSYIYNNWAGIVNYYKDENAIGCSAEGHVSHILSDRLSSRPMGWSEVGVDQMARLRSFKFNGGTEYELKEIILEKARKEQKEEKIVEIESKVVKNNLKKKFAEPSNNIPSINKGVRTRLFKAVKSLL